MTQRGFSKSNRQSQASRLAHFVGAFLFATLLGSGLARADDLQYRCDNLAERAELSDFRDAFYQGGNGWFFRALDFNHFYLSSTTTRRFLQRLSGELERHGVTLFLLPLPPKAVTQADQALEAVSGTDVIYEPDYARQEFEAALSEMAANGLNVIDVLDFITRHNLRAEDAYFARDIHWRPEFAKISAEATAEVIKSKLGTDDFGQKTFVTTLDHKEVYKPALSVLLTQLCATRVPYEYINIYQTAEEDASLDAFLADDAGGAPINIVGTSFTDELNRFNFSGFLRESLGSEVATYALSGGGVDEALYGWAHKGIVEGTKVLVWEVPYLERLEASAAKMERQIVPAIEGRCEPARGTTVASSPYEVNAEGDFVFDVAANLHVAGQGFYVNATLSDPSLRTFTLLFDYRDGSQELVPIVRPDRVGALPDLFAELSPDLTADLASVTLQAPPKTVLSGTISLCSYQ